MVFNKVFREGDLNILERFLDSMRFIFNCIKLCVLMVFLVVDVNRVNCMCKLLLVLSGVFGWLGILLFWVRIVICVGVVEVVDFSLLL